MCKYKYAKLAIILGNGKGIACAKIKEAVLGPRRNGSLFEQSG